MTTYRSIASTEIDPDSPVTATLMQALDDNPTAISEGATTAPYSGGALHPYTGVLVDDANSGVIYDFAVDGAVATVQTPDFESGYVYTVSVVNFSHSSGTDQRLQLDKYGVSDNLLVANFGLTGSSNQAQGITNARAGTTNQVADDYNPTTLVSVPQTALKYVIIKWSSGGSFDAGRVYLFRELDYSGRIE